MVIADKRVLSFAKIKTKPLVDRLRMLGYSILLQQIL